MKPCVGCTHLVSQWCHVHSKSWYETDELIGRSGWRTNGVVRAREMRLNGECGPDATLYKCKWARRLFHKLFGQDEHRN